MGGGLQKGGGRGGVWVMWGCFFFGVLVFWEAVAGEGWGWGGGPGLVTPVGGGWRVCAGVVVGWSLE